MTLYVSVGVRDLTLNKDVYVAASTGTIGVNGIFTPRSNKFPNVRLQDGSTLNLAEVDGAWSVDSEHPGFKTSIAPDATVTIDLGERNLHSGDRIVKWAAKPGELRSSQIKLKAKWKAFRVTVEDNGLYLRSGLVILVK